MLLRFNSLAAFIGLLFANSLSAAEPLPVFVLFGQSNMQGHAEIRTLDHLGMDPLTKPLLSELVSRDGTPVVCDDVWISSLSTNGERNGRLTAGFGANENKIGPEFSFGITMKKLLGRPVLIIKTAWGGKSLHTDFRSPSAGPYEFSDTQLELFTKQNKDIDEIRSAKKEATGVYYRKTLQHVKNVLADIKRVVPDYDASAGYQLSGMVWFQGWNDMVDRGTYPNRDQPGGYDTYTTNLAHMIRDFRKDLATPDLPFVIGVMGVNGPTSAYAQSQQRYKSTHQNIRDAMAAVALQDEFKSTVTNVMTEEFWDAELSKLRARENVARQRAKKQASDDGLDRTAARELQDKLIAEEFSETELTTLRTGVSNAEYHYMGSAKILTQIGQAFAKAAFELN